VCVGGGATNEFEHGHGVLGSYPSYGTFLGVLYLLSSLVDNPLV